MNDERGGQQAAPHRKAPRSPRSSSAFSHHGRTLAPGQHGGDELDAASNRAGDETLVRLPDGGVEDRMEKVRVGQEVLEGWRTDFVAIYRDVQDVVVQRHIYREIRAILEANEAAFAEMDGTVFEWLAKVHAHSAAVCVRKQVDNDSRSISLRRLLVAIAPKAALITRAEYVGRARVERDLGTREGRDELATWHQVLNERFDRLVGDGVPTLTQVDVERDLMRLDEAAQEVQTFVNKTIAHRDRKGIRVEATWEQLNDAVDLLEELVRRYNELLDAGQSPRLVPVWQYDWKAVFRIPWLKSA